MTWHPGARGMDFDTFISLCRAISRMMEVRREPHCNPGIVDLISEELSSYIVKSYVIERIRINQFVNIIGKYSLYCRLHNSNGIVISNFQQLCSVLSDSFSSTTVSDVKLLQSLILIGNRVDNICQVKFKSLISFVLDAMRVFMENKPNESLTVDDDILSRLKSVSNFMLKSIPFNIAEVERLKEAGYSQEIWSPTNRFRNHKERIQFFIQTTYPSINETRLKRKFLQNLKTFKIVLSKYSVNSLTIAGKEVLISELVDENLSLEELKIRKLEVKNLIEKEIIYSSSMTPEVSNMFDNLTESVVEDESTEEYTSEDSNMKEKQNSWLAVVSSWRFVDVIDCFSNSIEGCYSSNGSHAEKPLEIALRVNSLVLSLRNSSDTIEFENIEVLLTDQGALIYKIYGNGHESDTSAVWATFFCHLLREDLVPAIIIPNGFPNAQIFSFIRKHVFSESLSMILSYRANWFDEFCSYYDYLPSKAVGNYDLVLTKMNISKVLQVLGLESDSIILHQPRYRIENQGELDFSGILFRFVMQNMKKDSSPFLNSLSFLGKQIYSYLFSLIENGFSNPVVLSVEFDYTRWKRSIKIQSYLPSQVELFDILVSYIIKKVDEFICTCDLLELYEMNPRQFFELMRFFRKRVEFLNREEKKFHNTSRLYSLIVFRLRKFLSQANFSIDCVHSVDCKLKELVNFQRENSSILLISSFSVINQKRLIRWIFRNEESVWRFRGGRPNYETLEEYIQFLDQFSGNCRKSFPGVVILPSFREPLSEKSLLKLLESDRIIGYCIGEFSSSAELDKDSELNSCSYEFVCAWVDANFNGLHLASDMYLTCMKELYQVGCKTIQFDIVGRSWSRIKHSLVNNYWLYWLSTAINLEKLVIQDEKPSYTIMNFQSRTSEEFIHFKANLRWSLYLLKFVQWIARWISFE